MSHGAICALDFNRNLRLFIYSYSSYHSYFYFTHRICVHNNINATYTYASKLFTGIAIYTGVNDFYQPLREILHPLYAFIRLFTPGLRFTQELTTFTNLHGKFYTPFTPFYASLRPFTNHLLQNNNTNQRSHPPSVPPPSDPMKFPKPQTSAEIKTRLPTTTSSPSPISPSSRRSGTSYSMWKPLDGWVPPPASS